MSDPASAEPEQLPPLVDRKPKADPVLWDDELFVRMVRETAAKRHLTMDEVARRIGCSPAWFNQRAPTAGRAIATILRAAAALNIDPMELITGKRERGDRARLAAQATTITARQAEIDELRHRLAAADTEARGRMELIKEHQETIADLRRRLDGVTEQLARGAEARIANGRDGQLRRLAMVSTVAAHLFAAVDRDVPEDAIERWIGLLREVLEDGRSK